MSARHRSVHRPRRPHRHHGATGTELRKRQAPLRAPLDTALMRAARSTQPW